jgi:hypothetical protein
MKSFKQHINEDSFADHLNRAIEDDDIMYHEKRFANPLQFILNSAFSEKGFAIPLSKDMISKIQTVPNVYAVHFSTPADVKKLSRLQGSRKSISAITDIKESTLFIFFEAAAIESGNGAITLMTGDSVATFAQDAFTNVDNQGRRWLNIDEEMAGSVSRRSKDLKKNPEFIRQAKKAKRKILNLISKASGIPVKHLELFYAYGIEHIGAIDPDYRGKLDKLPNSLKNQCIRSWYDSCKKMFDTKSIQEDLKKVIFDSTESDSFNEVVLQNIKIAHTIISIKQVMGYEDPKNFRKLIKSLKNYTFCESEKKEINEKFEETYPEYDNIIGRREFSNFTKSHLKK